MPNTTHATENGPFRCCIAGGGPAGMMLGFLLARAGVDVLVLEKRVERWMKEKVCISSEEVVKNL